MRRPVLDTMYLGTLIAVMTVYFRELINVLKIPGRLEGY